jgi:molybdopterin-guanine dinucleotide biosynthesis protein A
MAHTKACGREGKADDTMIEPAGLVIAGGASSRFGGDKALALLRGRPLLAWSLAALDGVCREVAVNARPGGQVWTLAANLGRETLADDPAHPRGPLAGLAAGLVWASCLGRSILVSLPVDTPLVDAEAVRRLAEAAAASPAAFAVTSGGPHPLCAAWNVDLAPALIERLVAGTHPPVQAWLREVGATPVAFGDDVRFRNVNTRADLLGLATSDPEDA